MYTIKLFRNGMEETLSNCQLPDWKELPRQYCHQNNHPALEPSTMSSCISVSLLKQRAWRSVVDLAARWALSFAQEISIFSVEVEGDSLQVIRAINNKKLDRTGLGHIIQDIKQMGSCMQSYSFLHIGRGVIS